LKETNLELSKPLLSIVGLLLVEGEVDKGSVSLLGRVELEHVSGHVAEVLLRVGSRAGSQTLRE
jgi:hypothetical protein